MRIRSFMLLSAVAFMYTGLHASSSTLTPIVCQKKKCYPATAALSRESLFNRIQSLIEKNSNQNILLCEANPQSKMCLTKGFSLPLQTGSIYTELNFLSAKIIDNKIIEKTTGTDLIVDYKTKSDTIFPTCQTAPTRLGVLANDAVQIISPDFTCNFGQSNKTAISLNYTVDYINFDNGSIGAYYSIAAGERLSGQKSGYMLFRFAHPSVSNEQFPMPEILHAYKIEQQRAHTNISPVWMKPSPILNVETPEVITQPDGSLVIRDNPSSTQQPVKNVPSTTGLITQEKNVLPPVNGLRKTVTIKKQIFQKGKPVVYEENVHRYVQKDKNAPFIEEEKAIQLQKAAEPDIPQMPKPVNALSSGSIPSIIPEYIFPHEVTLTQEEVAKIQEQLPMENNVQNLQKETPATDSEATEPSGIKKLWGKIEKLFYF